jgi:hypothetical protein
MHEGEASGDRVLLDRYPVSEPYLRDRLSALLAVMTEVSLSSVSSSAPERPPDPRRAYPNQRDGQFGFQDPSNFLAVYYLCKFQSIHLVGIERREEAKSGQERARKKVENCLAGSWSRALLMVGSPASYRPPPCR